MTLRELLESRDKMVVEMRALADTAEAESRDLNADEDTRFAELKSGIATFDKRISRGQALAEAERSAPAITVSGRGADAFEARAHEFSITKVIAAQLGETVDIGRERELSAEVRRRNPGRKFQGIAVPDEVFHVERRALGDNVMLTSGAAADLYPTQHRPDLFIDRLRSALLVERLGATVLNDLQGDQDIPRQTGSASEQWVSEDTALTDTALSFDDVTLSPTTVGAITSYSRRTLINAAPAIEQIVRNDLAAVIARAIDLAALLGDGTGNQPTGIRYTPGVSFVSGLTPTWTQILGFVSGVEMGDANVGMPAWAMAPDMVQKLRSTLKESGDAGAGYLMMEPGTLAGYPTGTTSALSSDDSPATSTIIFGAFSQLLVGYWSGTDLLINPYESAAYARGRVLVRAMRDCDVGVRHPQSFVYGELTL